MLFPKPSTVGDAQSRRKRNLTHKCWDSPRPQTGPRIPISWKRGLRGPKETVSPRPGKGSVLSNNPLRSKNEDLLTENSLFEPGEGKRGVLDPETLFSGKWGFGALSGVGGCMPRQVRPRQRPRELIFLFSALQGLPTKRPKEVHLSCFHVFCSSANLRKRSGPCGH